MCRARRVVRFMRSLALSSLHESWRISAAYRLRPSWRPGLRCKFNFVIVPLLAAIVVLVAWLDYRHEVQATMAAPGIHQAASASPTRTGPIDPATTPEAVGRRSLEMHAGYALVTLLVVVIAVNTALAAFVLRPIEKIRDGIEQMERGRWRVVGQTGGGGGFSGGGWKGPRHPSEDEIGGVLRRFATLGLSVDALVAQLLHAERLATIALLTKKFSTELEPPILRAAASVARVHALTEGPARDAAEDAARATAETLAALRRVDRAFDAARAFGHAPVPDETQA